MRAYRQDVLLVPVRVPEVQHHGDGEEDIDGKLEHLEVGAGHFALAPLVGTAGSCVRR